MLHPSCIPRAILAFALGLPALLRAEPVITEFLAANNSIVADDDGSFSDWIEIHNPDTTPARLAGWYLTDEVGAKTKWQFPDVTLAPGAYLVVWASNENRRDPARPLHTNFALNTAGEYLALVKPDGVTVATEFAPEFPAQLDNVSYGITQPTTPGAAAQRGHFRQPTPGARNGGADSLLLLERVAFSRSSGPFSGAFTLTLSGAAPGQRIRYVVAAPSAAGASLPEVGPTAAEYTGPVTITASAIVRAMVFAADNQARSVAFSAHYVRLANSGAAQLGTFNSELPLLVIDTHGGGALEKDGRKHPGWIYTWNRPANAGTSPTAPPTLASTLTTNVRGASSATFPKKGYTLELTNPAGGDNPQPLFGLPASDRWTLVGPWHYDRTYVHNAFIYALSNRMGRWAPRTQFVEVFFNANGGDLDTTDYAGIYVLTDAIRVGADRVDITPLDSSDNGARSVTGGYIFKSDLPDPDEYSFQVQRGYPEAPFAWIVHAPKAAALSAAQRAHVTRYVQGLDDALASDYEASWRQRTYLDYIERSSWVDQHILNVLAMNVDAFVRSAYMTKDRGGRMVAGPAWDFDRTMDGGDARTTQPESWNGSFVLGESVATDLWGYGWWGTLAQDPEFVQEWIDRWQSLRRSQLANGSLRALVDSLAGQIGPAAAARDAARWPDNASRFSGGWQGEIDNLKSWLARRTAWIDAQFVAAPDIALSGNTITVTPAPGTQLAYTRDGTDPRAGGGAIANSAVLTASAVTFEDSVDFQARSFRAEPATGTPSSSWSSIVGGPKSPAVAPRPRLANISSRGFVGAGENVMITGVVVGDTAGKQYLARAVGPALTAFGVAGALAQPVLKIIDANGREVASNAGWENGADAGDIADFTKTVGAFPLAKGSRDAALLPRLAFGQYTLQISSSNGATGVALAELYEIESELGRTINLSTRGLVRAGEGLLIGGIVIRGPAPKRVLIRAVGPTLAGFGVSTALADPVLTLFAGATQVATNDDWASPLNTSATEADVARAAAAVGAFTFAPTSRDAALLITLREGGYTAQVTGKGSAEGVILLEAYELP